MNAINELESMHDMATRLYGTGGGEQAKAVIEAIRLIRSAPGILDANNRATALWHLAAALSDVRRAAQVIEDTALLVVKDYDSDLGFGSV